MLGRQCIGLVRSNPSGLDRSIFAFLIRTLCWREKKGAVDELGERKKGCGQAPLSFSLLVYRSREIG